MSKAQFKSVFKGGNAQFLPSFKVPPSGPGFRIEVGIAGNVSELELGENLSYDQINLDLDVEYCARVQAYNKTFTSEWTDWLYVTTEDNVFQGDIVIVESLNNNYELSSLVFCGFNFPVESFNNVFALTSLANIGNLFPAESFNNVFTIDITLVNLGYFLPAENFNNVFTLDLGISSTLSLSAFSSEFTLATLPTYLSPGVDFNNVFTLDTPIVNAGNFFPVESFNNNFVFESSIFYSMSVIAFSNEFTLNVFDIIPGYLFPAASFDFINEITCDSVNKLWHLFTIYSNSNIAQSTHQINSAPFVLYEFPTYFCNELSSDLVFFLACHNVIRDSDLSLMHCTSNSFGDLWNGYIANSILSLTFKNQYIGTSISSDSFISGQYISNNISDFSFVLTQIINYDIEYFGVSGSDGIASLWYDPPPGPQAGGTPVIMYIYFDIFVDGISVKERIRDVNLTQRESDVISHIEIEFKDTLSFNMCDVAQGTGIGTERIELRVGGDLTDPNRYTTYKFLLEERSANESNHSFTIWGRQITALLAEPFSDPITQTFENRTSSSIAQELAGSIVVNWTASDNLNIEYNLDGTPLAGIQRLAEVINAIVRTDPDGSLIVRPRFPVRPMDLIDGNCTVEATLDRYINIVSADYSEEQSQYNTIEVQGGGATDSSNIPIVSYEEYNYNTIEEVTAAEQKSNFQVGDVAYLRIYHDTGIVYDPTNLYDESEIAIGYSLCTTFSSTSLIQLDNDELIEDENIDIINGTGNLSKNPTNINSWWWEGTPKFGDCQENTVTVTFDKNNITAKDAEGNNVLIGKMKVTYTTQYDLFEITCNEEKEIIVATLTSEQLGVYLKITMDSVTNPDDEKPAPKVDDDLIVSEAVALIRGQSILDDTYYKKRKHTIQIPYYLDVGLFDGQVVRMEDDFWNIIGNAIIRSADISISADDSGLIKIWQNIELHQYARP